MQQLLRKDEELPIPNKNIRQLIQIYTYGDVQSFSKMIKIPQQEIETILKIDSISGKYPCVSQKIKDKIKETFHVDDSWFYLEQSNHSIRLKQLEDYNTSHDIHEKINPDGPNDPSDPNDSDSNEYNNSCIDDIKEFTTYLLPMTAMCSSLSKFLTSTLPFKDCEKIISPIKGVDFAITIYGESMAPEYPSGSRVLIKKIDPIIFIEWGKTYVLDTPNGVIVKEVYECKEKPGYIKCHSISPDPKFSDFEVPLSEVYGMYRVLMCLSAK